MILIPFRSLIFFTASNFFPDMIKYQVPKMQDKLKTIHHLGDKTYLEAVELLKKYPDAEHASLEKLRWMLRDPEILTHLHVGTRADLLFNPARSIPRSVMHTVADELLKYLHGMQFTVAGSYRRKKPISRDIDIVLVSTDDIHTVLQKFLHLARRSIKLYVYDPYQCGTDKASLIFEMTVPIELQASVADAMTSNKKIRIKADIFVCTPDEYMFTLLFATGSGDFNVRMRSIAKRKGYLLNQRGLFRDGERISVKSEKQLFEMLNIPYLEPEHRTA